jgi:hypothetical protein
MKKPPLQLTVGRCGLAAPTLGIKIYRKGAPAAALRAKEGKKVAKERRGGRVRGYGLRVMGETLERKMEIRLLLLNLAS